MNLKRSNIQSRVTAMLRNRKPNKLERRLISNYIEALLQKIDDLGSRL